MKPIIEITEEPQGLPITLDNAKAFLRITSTVEDDLINSLIGEAANMAERYTRRSIINRTIKLTMDGIPLKNTSNQWWEGVRQTSISELTKISDYIILPCPPIVSVTSVSYYTNSDTRLVLDAANYFLDTSNNRICLTQNGAWPTDLRDRAAIEVLYIAGYGEAPENVPQGLQGAIRSLVSFLYDNRDCGDMPETVMKKLDPYRIIDQLAYK